MSTETKNSPAEIATNNPCLHSGGEFETTSRPRYQTE